MSSKRNSLFLAPAIFLTGCGNRDETIVSLGVAVFVFTLVAFGIHALLGKLAAAESVRALLLRSKATIRILTWTAMALGVATLVFGISQDGVFELFSFVGISLMIIGALLPRSVNFETQTVDFKKVSLFLVCIYVLLFLIFNGDALFKL